MTRTLLSRALLPFAAFALAAVVAPIDAGATLFRRPFDPNLALGYGYDHNGAAGGCVDFACNSTCYDGHKGNDFPLPAGTPVLAGADGTVIFVNNGCANVGFIGSQCGGGAGNYVKLQHADGHTTTYMHQMLNSIVVSVGQQVGCGQMLGLSASSGNSSGNHLHFEPRSGNTAIDPFAGACNGPNSLWTGQNGYGPVSTACEVVCACSPGQVDTVPCGDCGTMSRTCQGTCSWGPFGPCAGPDPDGGNQPCTTSLLGPCAEGRVRCIDGNLACKGLVDPQPETCDGADNDCNELVDDGHPSVLGSPPPDFAATLLDVSSPKSLRAGARGEVWADLRNDGAKEWQKGELWLTALGAAGESSRLSVPGDWPAWNVAAVLDQPVWPGDTARFTFPITAPDDPGAQVVESFQLAQAGGPAIACPRADIEVSLRVLPKADASDEETQAGEHGTKRKNAQQGGCALSAGETESSGLTLMLGALVFAQARRARRRAARPLPLHNALR